MRRIGLALAGVLIAAVALFIATVQIRVEQPGASAGAAPADQADTMRTGSGKGAASHSANRSRGSAPSLIIPVYGVVITQISDSWGEPRGDGTRGHAATDIMAPGGTRVRAAASGTVEKLYFSEGGGGISAYVRSPDRRWIYYYAHLGGYAPGLSEGQRVRAGQAIGYVGDTGNAGVGNYHLHFGVSQARPDERWHQGTPVDPYPLLLAGARQGR